jgi:hypothetical protein
LFIRAGFFFTLTFHCSTQKINIPKLEKKQFDRFGFFDARLHAMLVPTASNWIAVKFHLSWAGLKI